MKNLPSTFPLQNKGTCALLNMVSEGHFLVPHAGRALAFFSRKHFCHSLKNYFVGFKVVSEIQSSFFSEASSLNPINIQNFNRHLLPNVPGKDPHIYIYPRIWIMDGEFLRLILSTKMKGHSLRNVSGL